ncbi:MAG: hypothetical protein R3B74_01285 [Nitrospirales bacterium]|nr:hypothetical protein [Nitrospirales bacterium]
MDWSKNCSLCRRTESVKIPFEKYLAATDMLWYLLFQDQLSSMANAELRVPYSF